jgi:hypothetical protein
LSESKVSSREYFWDCGDGGEKEGRKEGMKAGRQEGSKDGRHAKEIRQVGPGKKQRKEGRTRQKAMGGRKCQGTSKGRQEGRKEGRKVGRKRW